jgi:hypothetical protein
MSGSGRAGTVASAALVACSSVLGLDDFEVVGAAAGTGGSVADAAGATAGTGALDATGGGAAAGATGGTAATGGGAGTDAAACGSVLAPNLDVVRSCILRASCSPFVPNATISTCVSLDVQRAFLGTACTSNAQSCDDIELCEGYGFTDAECAGGQSGWRCENNVAINCDSGYFLSCNKHGGTCTMYDSDGDLVDDRAGCRVESGCFGSDEPQCNGDTLYRCYSGDGIGVICTNLGAKCKTVDGETNCFFQAPSCDGSEPPCAGNTGQQCLSGGTLLRWDCESVNLGCASDASGAYCVAPGCTLADVAACQESCSGSTLHLCYGGVRYDVDCQSYGFGTCLELDDAGGIGHFALCSR